MYFHEFYSKIINNINVYLEPLDIILKYETKMSYSVFPWVDINSETLFIPIKSPLYLTLYDQIISQKKYKGDIIKDLYLLQLSLNMRNVEMLTYYGDKYLNDLYHFSQIYCSEMNFNESWIQFYFSVLHEVQHIILKKEPSLLDDIMDTHVSLLSHICTIIPIYRVKKLLKNKNYLEEILCDNTAFDILIKLFPNEKHETLIKIISQVIWLSELETNNYQYLGLPNHSADLLLYESTYHNTSLRILFLAILQGYNRPNKLVSTRVPSAFSLSPLFRKIFINNARKGFILNYNDDELIKVIEQISEQENNIFDNMSCTEIK